MKQVLVIAKFDQAEAMRVAAGLTLLNDHIRIQVIGKLKDSQEVAEQKEVLDFAEVPCEVLDAADPLPDIAQSILTADTVFIL